MRALNNMTQKDLADAVGVTRQTINAIESGDYNPTINLCVAICKVLGKSSQHFFLEENSQCRKKADEMQVFGKKQIS
jgi:putative transcriptional regulator